MQVVSPKDLLRVSTMQQSHNFSSCQLRKCSTELPSAYITDADLFGDLSVDDDEPYLSEPPAPPRPAEVWFLQPLLPPVVNVKTTRQGSGSSKHRKTPHSKVKVATKG